MKPESAAAAAAAVAAAAAAANEMLYSGRREHLLALSIIICFAFPVIATAFTAEENNNEHHAYKQSFVLVQLPGGAAISTRWMQWPKAAVSHFPPPLNTTNVP